MAAEWLAFKNFFNFFMISTTEFIDLLAAHRSGVRTVKTICCLLLTVVTAGVAVGQNNSEGLFQRSVVEEVVSRTFQDLVYVNTHNTEKFGVTVSNLLPSYRIISVGITMYGRNEEPPELIDVIERKLILNLNAVLMSMNDTGQPIPEFLQTYWKRLENCIMDGTHKDAIKNKEFFLEHFPFEIVIN